MKERKLTCIVCPKGCELTVSFDSGEKISDISGYTCPRGRGYAESECTNPTRTVTSTVRCKDGSIVSVKTTAPIPKTMIFDIMAEINGIHPDGEVRIGDVIIADVCKSGSDIIATSGNCK